MIRVKEKLDLIAREKGRLFFSDILGDILSDPETVLLND